MEFGVLGPLRVADGGREIALSGLKHRALLALLVLNAREVVSVDRLVDELWGERPPRTARNSLQNYVSHLRKLLGADVLRTRPPGYVLDVEPETVDVNRFLRLLERARGSGAEERAELLRKALALWRGRALADLEFEPFALAEAPRLDELRAAADEELVAAELELGRHAELVTRIEALVAAHPLRERLRGQLMLALYRSGRQADALAAYAAARRTLVGELGIEPGPTLRALEAAILRQDPALDARVETTPTVVGLRDRRTTATVLYAELALPGGIDAEQHRALATQAAHELRAATEYHGGTVERLAGDELVAVFGVPTRREDDALRAVRAALQIARSLAESPSVDVRIAVDTGEVIGAAADARAPVVGAPMVHAKRLAQAAPTGVVMAAAATSALLGEAVKAEAVAPLTVRGREESVEAVRIDSVVEAGAVRRVGDLPLVGRTEELAAIHSAFEGAVERGQSVVFGVFGEAGVGKTRLAREVARSVGEGATVVVGRCVAYGEGATWLPLSEIVRGAGSEPARVLANTDEGERAASVLEAVLGREDTVVSIHDASWAARRYLEALAQDGPLLVVLDDLHWAEPTFVDFVEQLATTPSPRPIFVLALSRPELAEELPALHSLELGLLDPADARRLVDTAATESLTVELRTRIATLAEGNPLFAEQLVAYAEEHGEEAFASIPPTVEALIASRLDRLDAQEREVLERASVVGREFWQAAVLHLTPEVEVPAVGRHLRELERKGLVHRVGAVSGREDAFRFHHVLVRDVAYGAIAKAERSELHEGAAELLESQPDAADELIGFHLEQAYACRVEIGALDRHARSLAADAGERLAGAGIRAWKRADAGAAVNLIGRAVALLPDTHPDRGQLRCELGVALRHAGQGARGVASVRDALEDAIRRHDRRVEVRARVELASAALFGDPEGRADELLDLAATAIPVLEEHGDDRALGRIWLQLGYVHGGLHCRNAAWLDAAERALAHYSRAGWPTSACRQEIAAALFHGPTPVGDAIGRCRELLAGSDRSGEATVRVFLGGLEAMRGRPGVGRRLVDEAQAVFEELGLLLAVSSSSLWMHGVISLLQHDHAVAERSFRESCARLQASGDRSFLATRAAELAEALYRLQRYDEALAWTDISQSSAASDDVGAQFSWRSVRAKLLAHGGVLEQAANLADEAAELASSTDAVNQHASVLLDRAEVLHLADRYADAARSAEQALELFDAKGNVVAARRVRAFLSDLAVA